MSVQAVEKVKSMKVADVMKTTLDFIDGSATVTEAVRLMRKLRVSSLLVNKRNHDDASYLTDKSQRLAPFQLILPIYYTTVSPAEDQDLADAT